MKKGHTKGKRRWEVGRRRRREEKAGKRNWGRQRVHIVSVLLAQKIALSKVSSPVSVTLESVSPSSFCKGLKKVCINTSFPFDKAFSPACCHYRVLYTPTGELRPDLGLRLNEFWESQFLSATRTGALHHRTMAGGGSFKLWVPWFPWPLVGQGGGNQCQAFSTRLAVTCYSLELLQEFGNISGSGLVRTFFHETEFYVVQANLELNIQQKMVLNS